MAIPNFRHDERLKNLIYHPNIRRYFTDSNVKRSVDLILEEFYPQTKLVQDGNQIKFTFGPTGKKAMSFEEWHDVFYRSGPLRSTRTYSSNLLENEYVGAATNRLAMLFDRLGYTPTVRTWDLNKDTAETVLGEIKSPTGEIYGVPRFNNGKLVHLDVTSGNKRLTIAEVQKVLSDHNAFPTVFEKSDSLSKRLSVFLSDRVFSMADTPISVHHFNPKRVAEAFNPDAGRLVDSFIASTAPGTKKISRKTAFEKMYDGEVLLNRRTVEQMFSNLEQEANSIEAQASRLPLTERAKHLATAKTIREEITKQRKSMFSTGRVNIRMVSEDFNYKGDAGVIMEENEEVFRKIFRLSKERFANTHAFVSSADKKRELRGTYFLSFESHGVPKQGRTNILSLSAHSRLFGDNFSFVNESKIVINELISDIKNGKITPGIRNLINELSEMEILPEDNETVIAKKMRSRAFAQRIKTTLDSGLDINQSPRITSQLLDAVQDHFLTVKNDEQIILGGRSIPNYNLNFPIRGSVGTHLTVFPEANKDLVDPGTVRFEKGVAHIHPGSFLTHSMLHGGHDLDDRIVWHMQYDEKTRRIFALGIRDPTEKGEFGYYNVDLTSEDQSSAFRRIFDQPDIEISKSGKKDILRGNYNQVRQLSVEERKLSSEIENLFLQREALDTRLPDYEKTYKRLTQKIRTATFELDSTRSKLHLLMMRNKRIAKIDLASTFSPAAPLADGSPAMPLNTSPKGMRTTVESMNRYTTPSASHSYHTSRSFGGGTPTERANAAANAIVSERKLERTLGANAGAFPFEISAGTDEWHDALYTRFKATSLSREQRAELDRLTRGKTLDKLIEDRLGIEARANGLLGQLTDARFALDNAWDDILNNSNLPPELRAQIIKIAKSSKQQFVEYEVTVDEIKKTGNIFLIDDLEREILHNNPRKFGAAFAKAQALIERYNRSLPVGAEQLNIGFDSAMAQARMSKPFQQRFIQAYNEQIGAKRKIKSITEVTKESTMSGFYKGKAILGEHITDMGKPVIETAFEERVKSLSGLVFTTEEEVNASKFISDMKSFEAELSKRWNIHGMEQFDSAEEFLAGGIDELHTAAVRKLYDMGLFKKVVKKNKTVLIPTHKLKRQILAIDKLAAENKISLNVLEDMGLDGGGSMIDMLAEARRELIERPKTIAQLRGIESFDEIRTFFRGTRKGRFVIGNKANAIDDPIQRGLEILNSLGNIDAAQIYDPKIRGSMIQMAKAVKRNMVQEGGSRASDKVLEFADNIIERVSNDSPEFHELKSAFPHKMPKYRPRKGQVGINEPTPGSGRFAARSLSDAAAEEVPRASRQYMTRINRDLIKDLWKSESVFRKSVYGFGIFAGIGLIHRFAKNPAPEDMGGPPLLPGGSPYEDYDPVGMQAISSIYPSQAGTSSGGMMYTVNTSSGYDPHRLSINLSEITGGSSRTNIYSSRRTVGKTAYSSRDVLNERLG